MLFTKMQGLGNDFIIMYGETTLPDRVAELAIALCDRHFGVGADGLVYILPSARADFKLHILNADGTEAEQCGNAIRCVAKYVVDEGHAIAGELTIETKGAGVQQVQLHRTDGEVDSVRVDMGEPVLSGLKVPTTLRGERIVAYPIEVECKLFRFTAVSMGNPHCVIFVKDVASFDFVGWGAKLEVHSLFPRKMNVEFATVRSRNEVEMRVWERGVGPTLACGTGACATLVAGVLNGLTDRQATLSLAGGDLWIEWKEADNHVYMTGPAQVVFKGEWL